MTNSEPAGTVARRTRLTIHAVLGAVGAVFIGAVASRNGLLHPDLGLAAIGIDLSQPTTGDRGQHDDNGRPERRNGTPPPTSPGGVVLTA